MTLINIILFLILVASLVCLIFVLYDVWHDFSIWQSRIHMGRWNNLESWNAAITTRAAKWLKHTPIVPKIDYQNLLLWHRLKKNWENNTIQSWQIAGLIMGLNSKFYKIGDSEIKKLIDRFSNNPNVDKALFAYSLLNIDNPTEAERKLINEFSDKTRDDLLVVLGKNKTIPYQKNLPTIRFVDTLGFVCPFLARYGIMTKEESLLELSEHQIKEYRSFFHPVLHLPPHAYNIHNSCPMGVYDWGRGIGWYILSLTETRRSIINIRPSRIEFYNYLCKQIKELADTVILFQKNNGGFCMFLTDEGGQYESSATVMCGLLFVDAYEITGEEKYIIAAKRTIEALMSVTQRNGAIDLCQGDTKGIALYSTRLTVMPFIQGLSVLLATRYVSNS